MVGILPIVAFRSLIFGRFGVSLPFVNYGGVVADSDEVAAALLEAAAADARGRGGCTTSSSAPAPHDFRICRPSSTKWR